MKRFPSIFAVLALMFMSLGVTACTSAEPNPGHEVVLVEKPWFVGHGGVVKTPVKTGQQYAMWSTEKTDVNMQPQRVDLAFDDMMTSSGVPVDFHVVLTLKVNDSVKLVDQFGADMAEWKDDKGNVTQSEPGFFYRNLEQPIRTAVRDAVKKHDMQEMAITATAVDAVQKEVLAATLAIVQKSGVPVDVTELNVGRVNPPDAVKSQRIATAAQEQRVITEQQTKLAEDQRRAAELARAEADNAYNNKMQLTPQQYVELERIKMLHDTCVKGSCNFYIGGAPTLVQAVK